MVQEAPNLKGKTIAITRPPRQAKETGLLIKQMGGRAYYLPTIKPKPLRTLNKIRNFLSALEDGRVDYVVFMSVNGVKYFCDAAERLGMTEKVKEALRKTVVVAVGPKTAQALKQRGLNVGLIPEEFSSEGIVKALRNVGVKGKTVYVFRAKGASSMLSDSLMESGALVKEIFIYEIIKPRGSSLEEKFLRDLHAGKIDAIIFGSSQSVKNFFQMFEDKLSKDELLSLIRDRVAIVAIGPFTAKALIDMGLEADVTPNQYTFEDALTALIRFWME